MHRLIQFTSIALSYPHKRCFEDFSATIPYGSRIALIGRNGSGKSSLLKLILGTQPPTDGQMMMPEDLRIAYVPQVIEEYETLSGGQRLNEALTQALSMDPHVLLLDEPTNHLDAKNRRSLMRMLHKFPGTLIAVTHDRELIRQVIDTLWHIDDGRVHVFSGNYEDYLQERTLQQNALEQEIGRLNRQKLDTHQALMAEQHRAKNSRSKGEKNIDQRKWPTVVSSAKARRAEETSGRKRAQIDDRKQELSQKLAQVRLPEILKPTFHLKGLCAGEREIVSICDGSVGYDYPLLSDIRFSLYPGERLAITGNNGSGKTTLIKAIMGDPGLMRLGTWTAPKREDIGYLDQHYGSLSAAQTVMEAIQSVVPDWTHGQIRRHLNDFLFCKNEEVSAVISTLSGGEKARLSLAQIAAFTPRLLILDEITNNLDLETKEHVTQILKDYPGALMVISHDEDFLKGIGVEQRFQVGE